MTLGMVHLTSLVELLKDKIDVQEYYRLHQSGTRLSWDCQRKCMLSIICQLTDLGTDLDVQDDYGNTPLVYALQLGCLKSAIIKLIERGADVNKSNDKGASPLFFALKFDHDKEVIDKLLEYGADVNAKDESDGTPLMCALMRNSFREVILSLLNATSDINHRDKFGYTAMTYAVQRCNDEDIYVRLIDHGADTTFIDDEGNSLLHHASGSAWEYISSFLFSHGISINMQNHRGETPLFVAVRDNDYMKVNSLLILGCDPNITNNDQRTPLHAAADEVIINHLFYYKSNVKAKDKFNCTPLDKCLSNLMWVAAQSMIKNFLLLSDENEVSQSLVDHLECSDYLRKDIELYKKELNEMKKYNITNNLSFYDFCVRKKFKYSKFIRISKSDYLYKYQQISKFFPNYFDIILMRIIDNEMENNRHGLLKSLEKVRIKSFSFFDCTIGVEMNYDCIESVARHLNHKELYSLILASL